MRRVIGVACTFALVAGVPVAASAATSADGRSRTTGVIAGKITPEGGRSRYDFVSFNGVELFGSHGSHYHGDVNTQGRYRVNGLPADRYVVCFDEAFATGIDSDEGEFGAECYVNKPYEDGSNRVPAGTTSVSVTAGHVTTGINATLSMV